MSSRQNLQSPAAAAAALAASNNLNTSNYQSNTNVSNVPQYSLANSNIAGGNNTTQFQQSSSPQQQQQPQQQTQQQQPAVNSASANANASTSGSGSGSGNSSQVVGLHYKIGKKIGEGSFGVIFEGTNLINGVPVAIKFEPRKTEAPQLRDEYRTYKHLNGVKGIPNAYYFGQEGLHNILVIDLLGPSLEDLFDWCGRKFSVKTVVQVAVQMITLIERVHQHDLIYRDIKPDNFLIGRHGLPDENSVHLVDFGMAKQYRDPRTKQHIPYREKKSLSGTARYMSINTHLGREQSRRDDLEALGHVFFYFLRGQLPWQGLKAPTNKQKYEKIGDKKRTTPTAELCQGLPPQFGRYLDSVRNLQFEAEPDYEHYRQLLLSVLPDMGETADGHYDWMDLNSGRGWDSTINKKPNLHGYGHPNPPGERHRHQQRRTRNSQPQAQSQQPHAYQQQAIGTGTGTGAQQPQSASPAQQLSPIAQQQPSASGQPLQNQQSNDNRPLPNLPEQQNFNQKQPQAVDEPSRSQQQQKDNESTKSNKGFFGKLACC